MLCAGNNHASPGADNTAGSHRNGDSTSLTRNLISGLTGRKQFIALSDQVAASATNFLTGVIIGRACVKEELGLYMLGMSIVVFSTTLQTSLISSPFMVFSPRLKGRAHALYTGSTLVHQLGLSLTAVVLLALGDLILSLGFGPQGLAAVLRTLAVVIPFILLREYARRVCFANLQFTAAFFIDLCVAVLQVSGLLFLAYFDFLSASSAYVLIGVSGFFASLIWLIYSRSSITVVFKNSIRDFSQNWSFGKWVFASGLLSALCANLYPWILTFFHGTGSAGVWAACFGIVSLTNPVILGVQNHLGPKMAHTYSEDGRIGLRHVLFQETISFALLLAPLCIVLSVFGGYLVEFIYGTKYSGNGIVVAVLALNFLISAASFSFSRALFVMNRANIDFVVNFTILIVLLTLGTWLVARYGPLGVALGLLVGSVVSSGIKGIVVQRYLS